MQKLYDLLKKLGIELAALGKFPQGPAGALRHFFRRINSTVRIFRKSAPKNVSRGSDQYSDHKKSRDQPVSNSLSMLLCLSSNDECT